MSGSGISARQGQRCPRSSSKRVLRLDRRNFRSSNILSPQSAWAPPHPGRHEQRQYSTAQRSEEHTSELQSRLHLVCRLLLEKKKNIQICEFQPQLERST